MRYYLDNIYGEKAKMKILFVIPARGGSKGIPRKNIRILAGKPLIYYSIANAKRVSYDCDIIVSTDDNEIKTVSESCGAEVIMRPEQLATDNVTLDPVISHCVKEAEERKGYRYDIVVTLQPTSPLLTEKTLNEAIGEFIEKEYDTMISGINSPHLAWGEKDGSYYPLYEERKNRQELPKYLKETGAFVVTKRKFVTDNSRLGSKLTIFEMPSSEAVDIDHYSDWFIAEKELSKKNILLRVDGYRKIGMGHYYRCQQIAYSMPEHNVRFVLSSQSDLAIEKVKQSFYPYDVINSNDEIIELIDKYNADIVVNDILDTDSEYINLLKSKNVRVVNFEDIGEGSKEADATINALYEKKIEGNHYYWGSRYYCIRDEFLLAEDSKFNKKVENVLVLFGGTDPCNLSMKLMNIVKQLAHDIKFTFILGMGYGEYDEILEMAKGYDNIEIIQNINRISDYMNNADVAISSQGRTMFELASVSVPTIILAQNERELHHEFGYLKNGFINLGMGDKAGEETIKHTLMWLINCPEIRMQMKEQMNKRDLKKGIELVKDIILGEQYEL